MLQTIANLQILGIPLIIYGGIITFISFLITASVGYMVMKGSRKISIKTHRLIAIISIFLALFHAVFGMSVYFNF